MDWNDLKYIIAIAEFGSLNAAANQLNVNHSTVYRRVHNLQDQLGVSLVVASRQGYHLSQEGLQLLPFAKAMAAQADAIELEIGGKNPTLAGLIRITAPGSVANETLPPLLAKFRTLYPNISFDVLEASAEFNLNRREADIAIRGTAKPPEHLIGRKISTVGWGIYIANDLLAHYQSMSFDELKQQSWVGLSDSIQSTPAKWLRQQIKTEQFSAFFNSTIGCFNGCQSGLGLALLPNNIKETSGITKLCNQEFEDKHSLWILMPKELKTSAKISTFYRFLAENWPEQ